MNKKMIFVGIINCYNFLMLQSVLLTKNIQKKGTQNNNPIVPQKRNEKNTTPSKDSSKQSSQNSKIQRRSNSLRFKKYKEKKSQISQVYIKAKIVDKLTNSSGDLNRLNHFTSQKNLLLQKNNQQNSNQRINRFQESKINNTYKRPLTPHKTAKQIEKIGNDQTIATKSDQLKQEINTLNSLIDQKQIQLAEIQHKNKKIVNENQILKNFAKELEKDRNKLIGEKQKTSKQILILEQELNNKTMKLQKLETIIIQNQSNLSLAKNSLEKLKKIIKQSRITELQKQNKKLEEKLNLITKQNASLKSQYKNIQSKYNNLEKQYELTYTKLLKIENIASVNQKSSYFECMRQSYLHNQINQLRTILNQSKESKEKQLQNIIQTLRQEIFLLNNKNKKLQVKMNCLIKNQLKSTEQLKKEKQKELNLLRDHFRKFLLQYKKYRKQHNQLKLENLLLKREKSIIESDDQEISLQLSPQKK